MGSIFKSSFHEECTWLVAYIPYGGLDFGEIQAVGQIVGDGDDSAFYEAWIAAGDKFVAEARGALEKGRRVSARELFLKASCAYATSYRPLFGEPVDSRIPTAFRKLTDAFDNAQALSASPVRPVRIPFEGTSMPAYFIPAENRAGEVRPLLILTNGYDGTIADTYFASAVAASRRGYHCLLFDGPGQGEMLIEQDVHLRHDWENVIRPVVDYALTLPTVDADRIALYGWSLGGYLAPRAASGESRIAACIADPALWSVASGFRPFAMKLGVTPEAANNLGDLDQSSVDSMWKYISHDSRLRWSVGQRGFWVNGVSNLRDYLKSAELFTMDGRIELIHCPVLLTQGMDDARANDAGAFFDALRCPKELIRYTAADGAGDHCEMRNRSLLNRNVLDWLDSVFGPSPTSGNVEPRT